MLFLGMLIMYVISSLIILIDDYQVSNWFIKPLELVFRIIIFPFIFIWKLFRYIIFPISAEGKDQFIKDIIYHSIKIGPIYFHHDKKATNLTNKNFFFRVKKPIDK